MAGLDILAGIPEDDDEELEEGEAPKAPQKSQDELIAEIRAALDQLQAAAGTLG